MISHDGKDPDLREFSRRLGHTHRGRIYAAAWRDMERSLVQLALHHGNALKVAIWRRHYISASDSCSRLLKDLEQKDSWPA